MAADSGQPTVRLGFELGFGLGLGRVRVRGKVRVRVRVGVKVRVKDPGQCVRTYSTPPMHCERALAFRTVAPG